MNIAKFPAYRYNKTPAVLMDCRGYINTGNLWTGPEMEQFCQYEKWAGHDGAEPAMTIRYYRVTKFKGNFDFVKYIL